MEATNCCCSPNKAMNACNTPNKLVVKASGDCDITFTRTFDAPADKVFDGLLQPHMVKQWLLGPPGSEFAVCEAEVVKGGSYRYVWESKDGEKKQTISLFGEYRELNRPHRMVHTERFGEACFDSQAVITSTLTEKDGKTVFHALLEYPTTKARDDMMAHDLEKCCEPSYARLEALAAGKPLPAEPAPTLVVSEEYAVAPERVFDAWLNPKQVSNFLFRHPQGKSLVCEIDARVGGKFNFTSEWPDGAVMEHLGEYKVIDRPRRLDFNFVVPKACSEVSDVSIVFEKTAKGCKVTITQQLTPQFVIWKKDTEKGWRGVLEAAHQYV